MAQCQLNRSVLRRPPQAMEGLKQAFDPNKFNFNLICPEKELICILQREGQLKERKSSVKKSSARKGKVDVGDFDYENSGDSSPLPDFDYEDVVTEEYIKNNADERGTGGEDRIISNVSPIDLGHSLLLPSVDLCQPQVLSEDAVRLALEVMFLSRDPNIRICFNSLCAFASVNHLHWHLFYLPYVLFIQTVRLQPLPTTSKVYEFPADTYPAKGWIFTLSEPKV